jgi:beta-xylosidase
MTKKAVTVRIAVALAMAVTALVAPLSFQSTAPQADAAVTRASSGPAFGAQFHGTWANMTDPQRDKVLTQLKNAGASWVRIDLGWTAIQPTRGKFDMRWGVPFVDKVLNMAHNRGLKVLVMFWQTPKWASGSSDTHKLPRNMNDYAKAIKFAANRWRTQVQAWQVWNEPNTKDFLNPPSASNYTRLLKAAYPAVKAGNPRAQVVFGGTMYIDTKFIAKAYAAGAKGKFDVMAVHAYQGNAALGPEASDRYDEYRMVYTAALIKLMRQKGDGGKKIWFTEFGWPTHGNTRSTPIWDRGVSEKTQAAYLVRTLKMLKARFPQVTTVFWYNSHDRSSGTKSARTQGLMRRNLSPKPALAALKCYLRGCR